MKARIKNIFQTILFLFCLLPVWVDAADYFVSTETSTVDGDTFCGRSACTSSDKIIIRGGARGNLLFKDFDGNGSYITITNEDTNPDDKKVVITTGNVGPTYAGLELRDCKYVNLEGNNDADLTYGIKVICDGTPEMASAVWVRGESDHINISYIEMAFDGNKGNSGNGIFIQDSSLDDSWIYDTVEIHHNFIHGTRYAGMYLGQNYPSEYDNPYIANLSLHDNLLEDIGSYGITVKGVHKTSGVILIYNNVIRRTGLIYNATVGEKRNGIKTHCYYGSTYANVYGNWIEATKGAGLVIGSGDHQVYNNTLVNCGTNNNTAYGHGMKLEQNGNTANIYDNIIIQPVRYGIYHAFGTGSINVDRNLIGNPGVGYVESDSVLVEGSGANANIKHTDVADFNFPVWSDDGDYNNDIFTIPQASLKKPTGLTIDESTLLGE